MTLNGRPYSVIGVAPAGFPGLLFRGISADVWVPVSMMGQVRTDQLDNRAERWSRAEVGIAGHGEIQGHEGRAIAIEPGSLGVSASKTSREQARDRDDRQRHGQLQERGARRAHRRGAAGHLRQPEREGQSRQRNRGCRRDGPHGTRPVWARRFWPEQDAVGQRVRIGSESCGADSTALVVGVAADAKVQTLGEAPQPFLYLPLRSGQSGLIRLLVRARDEGTNVVGRLEREVRAIDPAVAVFEARSMND